MTTTKTTTQVSGVSCTPVMGPSPFAVAGVSPTEGTIALALAECAKLRRNVEHYTALSASLGALVRELEAKVIDKDREIETLRRAAVRAVWQTSLRKGGTNVEPLAPRPPRAQTRGTDEEGGAA